MIRNAILPITQVIRFHRLSNILVNFQSIPNQYSLTHRLTFTSKYGFFNRDPTVDYNKNYYEILHVNEKASLAQIKKSFYHLAKESHPDTSKGNEDTFKSINEAYNVLSHEERRKLYDANRIRKEEQNPNDAKAEAQRNSSYDSRQTQERYDPKSQQSYEYRKAQAYYHFNQGQWQQFRSGYKYHISPEEQYFSNLTNNTSSQKLYQTMKRNNQKRSKKDEQFLDEMEQYFAYVEKVRRKKQQDIDDYHRRLEEMERKYYEQKKQKFRKSLIGRGYSKVQSVISKVTNLFKKSSGKEQNSGQKE